MTQTLTVEGTGFALDGAPFDMWGIRLANALETDAVATKVVDQLDSYLAYGAPTRTTSSLPRTICIGVVTATISPRRARYPVLVRNSNTWFWTPSFAHRLPDRQSASPLIHSTRA